MMASRSIQPYRRSVPSTTIPDTAFSRSGTTRSTRSKPASIGEQYARRASTKVELPPPASVFSFFFMVVIHVCKLILHFPSTFKAILYLIMVFLFSALSDLLHLGRKKGYVTYLAKPGNIFSVLFVQYAQWWTLAILFFFVTATSYFYSSGKARAILRQLTRLLVMYSVFQGVNFLITFIHGYSGFCSDEEYKSQKRCLSQGHRWLSFEISDETFFLIYFSLVIMEESQVFARWETLDAGLRRDPMNTMLSPEQSERNVAFARKTYRDLSLTIKILFFMMTIMCLLWDAMLIINSLFYQNLAQKSAACLLAVSCWFLTYRLWYPNLWPRSPNIGIFRKYIVKTPTTR
ncbi:hypothetical protein RvY_03410 [Ramazzottius varieornatus]|uniref:Uncharacterized protein n=1 Tax=Ramazzottius varieornatus TaxID=947166 RepID=A0A1D1UMY2_RAMVA|nr:hypothetical protein RvY_03410 [Ramazzottius varieornatus]